MSHDLRLIWWTSNGIKKKTATPVDLVHEQRGYNTLRHSQKKEQKKQQIIEYKYSFHATA
jgi:hypothetical protein